MSDITVPAVVVGVDGSPGGAGALRYAVAEARRRRAPLRLVHVQADGVTVVPVVTPSAFGDAGRAVLDQATATAGELGPDLDIDSQMVVGQRSQALVAASRDAGVLVLGRETRTGLDRLLTGTTTAGAAAHASCEVIAVPSFWEEDHHRRVVVGVRSAHDAGDAVARAFAEAAWRRCPLTLVKAWYLPDPYLDRIEVRTQEQEWVTAASAELEHLVAPHRAAYPDVVAEIAVKHGRPASVLLGAAAASDLLVVSRRRFALPPHERLGGVAQALLRASDVPVLVVPCPRPSADVSVT